MGEKIREEATGREINIPDGVKMGEAARDPRIIIATLEACNGDIDAYCKQFTTRSHVANHEVLHKTLLLLNKPEHKEYKEQWDALLSAFRQAKLLAAQNKACNAIANYNYPKTKAGKKSTQMTQEAVIRLASFWYKGWQSEETSRGRKRVDEEPPLHPPPPEPEPEQEPEIPAPHDPLDDILAEMQKEEE